MMHEDPNPPPDHPSGDPAPAPANPASSPSSPPSLSSPGAPSRRRGPRGGGGGGGTTAPAREDDPPGAGGAQGQQQQQQIQQQRQRRRLSSLLSTLPTRLVLLIAVLLRAALYPLRLLSAFVFPPREYDGLAVPGVGDGAARAFVAMFRRQYLLGGEGGRRQQRPPAGGSSSSAGSSAGGDDGGERHDGDTATACPFVPHGYGSTLTDLADKSPRAPLLLVYLHSPLHPGSDAFCARTLSDPSVLSYLNGSGGGQQPAAQAPLRTFGASVQTADGAHVAGVLGAAAYPFVALVNVKASGGGGGGGTGGSGGTNGVGPSPSPNVTLELLLKLEGRALLTLTPPSFLSYVNAVVARHGQILAEAEAQRLRREEEANLRREQDREFREALEADRAREAERRAEAERVEREEREREEEAQRVEEEREGRLAKAMSLVGDEPPAGTKDVARVRLTLPNGRRVDRRFRRDDTVGTVRAFLTVYFHENQNNGNGSGSGNSISIENFSLSTSFPKRTYDDPDVTLEDAGLVPQAVLMVQDLDA